jgi:hypothetical protein
LTPSPLRERIGMMVKSFAAYTFIPLAFNPTGSMLALL